MATKSTFSNMLKQKGVAKKVMTEGDVLPSKSNPKIAKGKSSYSGMLKKGEKC